MPSVHEYHVLNSIQRLKSLLCDRYGAYRTCMESPGDTNRGWQCSGQVTYPLWQSGIHQTCSPKAVSKAATSPAPFPTTMSSLTRLLLLPFCNTTAKILLTGNLLIVQAYCTAPAEGLMPRQNSCKAERSLLRQFEPRTLHETFRCLYETKDGDRIQHTACWGLVQRFDASPVSNSRNRPSRVTVANAVPLGLKATRSLDEAFLIPETVLRWTASSCSRFLGSPCA